MNVGSRRLVRSASVGAVALIAAGAMATIATPAYAVGVDADLAITASGGTFAAGTSGKDVSLEITNNGPAVPDSLVITLDLRETKLDLVNVDTEGCTQQATKGLWDCPIPAIGVPAAGLNKDFFQPITRTAIAKDGVDAGKVTFVVSHSGTDAKADNNSATINIVIAEVKGPDLVVSAFDVKEAAKVDSDGFPLFDDDGAPIADGPLNPGETAALQYSVFNQGSVATSGLKVTTKLPENVSFPFEFDDCMYDDANRTALCVYDDIVLVPADEAKPDEGIFAGIRIWEPIAVSNGVAAPASLLGGLVTAEPIVLMPENSVAKASRVLPKNVTGIPNADVDPSDNSDDYAVIVAKPAAGGSLPITGAKAGLLGGAGAAVLAVGGVLFMMARRRRVVLVNPTD